LALLALPAGLLFALPAWAGIDTTPVVPTEGQETMVSVHDAYGNPVAGMKVEAVYRPGSEVSRTEVLGATGEGGTVAWMPTGAGVVTLQTVPADTAGAVLTRDLSVRFDGMPLPGLVILLAAGIILYTGVIRGFRSLRELPPELPPDT
jgi:hypothetical protein